MSRVKPKHNATGTGCPVYFPGCSPAYLCPDCVAQVVAEMLSEHSDQTWTVLELDEV